MSPEAVVSRICTEFSGVVPKSTWGETSLFYNPEKKLPNGIYFCTLKEKDGEHDQASNLNREAVFRLGIGLPSKTYISLFGEKPPRPTKGGIVSTGHDFTLLNELTPHPVYAWMGWVQILSPTENTLGQLWPLLRTAYAQAIEKFDKKTARK
ncbi:MAG: hypothetical protein F6K00_27555 [Leptolyngbya sp. SIOISBB]|nr:hypothetical protein [Leptolyngbya sp. SIOISBB]